MKSFTIVFVVSIFLSFLSCSKKEIEVETPKEHVQTTITTQPNSESELSTTGKIMNYDPHAFVGDWIEYKTVTWESNDNCTEENYFDILKITEENWILNGDTTPYDLCFLTCWFIQPVIIFNPETYPDSVRIDTYGGDNLNFKMYEYPEDPDIFRVDHHYTPM